MFRQEIHHASFHDDGGSHLVTRTDRVLGTPSCDNDGEEDQYEVLQGGFECEGRYLLDASTGDGMVSQPESLAASQCLSECALRMSAGNSMGHPAAVSASARTSVGHAESASSCREVSGDPSVPVTGECSPSPLLRGSRAMLRCNDAISDYDIAPHGTEVDGSPTYQHYPFMHSLPRSPITSLSVAFEEGAVPDAIAPALLPEEVFVSEVLVSSLVRRYRLEPVGMRGDLIDAAEACVASLRTPACCNEAAAGTRLYPPSDYSPSPSHRVPCTLPPSCPFPPASRDMSVAVRTVPQAPLCPPPGGAAVSSHCGVGDAPVCCGDGDAVGLVIFDDGPLREECGARSATPIRLAPGPADEASPDGVIDVAVPGVEEADVAEVAVCGEHDSDSAPSAWATEPRRRASLRCKKSPAVGKYPRSLTAQNESRRAPLFDGAPEVDAAASSEAESIDLLDRYRSRGCLRRSSISHHSSPAVGNVTPPAGELRLGNGSPSQAHDMASILGGSACRLGCGADLFTGVGVCWDAVLSIPASVDLFPPCARAAGVDAAFPARGCREASTQYSFCVSGDPPAVGVCDVGTSPCSGRGEGMPRSPSGLWGLEVLAGGRSVHERSDSAAIPSVSPMGHGDDMGGDDGGYLDGTYNGQGRLSDLLRGSFDGMIAFREPCTEPNPQPCSPGIRSACHPPLVVVPPLTTPYRGPSLDRGGVGASWALNEGDADDVSIYAHEVSVSPQRASSSLGQLVGREGEDEFLHDEKAVVNRPSAGNTEIGEAGREEGSAIVENPPLTSRPAHCAGVGVGSRRARFSDSPPVVATADGTPEPSPEQWSLGGFDGGRAKSLAPIGWRDGDATDGDGGEGAHRSCGIGEKSPAVVETPRGRESPLAFNKRAKSSAPFHICSRRARSVALIGGVPEMGDGTEEPFATPSPRRGAQTTPCPSPAGTDCCSAGFAFERGAASSEVPLPNPNRRDGLRRIRNSAVLLSQAFLALSARQFLGLTSMLFVLAILVASAFLPVSHSLNLPEEMLLVKEHIPTLAEMKARFHVPAGVENPAVLRRLYLEVVNETRHDLDVLGAAYQPDDAVGLLQMALAYHHSRYRAKLYVRGLEASWLDRAVLYPLRDAYTFGVYRGGIVDAVLRIGRGEVYRALIQRGLDTVACLAQSEVSPCPSLAFAKESFEARFGVYPMEGYAGDMQLLMEWVSYPQQLTDVRVRDLTTL